MTNRQEIMDFFRNDEFCENISTFSDEDRHELMLLLCEHSENLYQGVHKAIERYEEA